MSLALFSFMEILSHCSKINPSLDDCEDWATPMERRGYKNRVHL